MSELINTIRRVIYGEPLDSADRKMTVRKDIVETVEENSWEWNKVENSANAAYQRLQDGELPEGGDEVQDLIRDVCVKYRSRGYTLEELKWGIDGVKATASAKQANKHSQT